MAHVAEIGPEREHEKQPAEHVAPLGHPGHRLDVLRMNGKDRGNEALGQSSSVIRHSTRNKAIDAAAWSSTLVRWCPQECSPKSWQSSMCDKGSNGYHSPAGPSVKAQRTDRRSAPP